MKSLQNRDEVPMLEVCGPVQTPEGGEYYVGAIRATNHIAEMQALIQTLFWLIRCVEQKGFQISNKVMVTVDSSYVNGLIDGKLVARENKALANFLCHMWKVNFTYDGYRDTLVMWETPLLTSLRIWEHIWKHSIDGGREFNRWAIGKEDGFQAKTSSLQREIKHRVNTPFASSGQMR